MKKINSLLVVLLSSLIFSTCAFAQEDPVVATVGETKITKSQLEIYHGARLLQFSNREITKMKSLGDLINREVTLQRARELKLANISSVKDQMDNVLYQAMIAQDLNNAFMKIQVSDEEIQKYYKKNPEYRTSLILLRLPVQPSGKQTQKVYQRAVTLFQQIRSNPKNFDTMAKANSQLSPDINPNMPDIGFQPARQLTPEYNKAITGRDIGYITPPFRTQFGFNIVKITDVKNIQNINKETYKAIIFDIKKQAIMSEYFSSLVDKTKVKVNNKLVK